MAAGCGSALAVTCCRGRLPPPRTTPGSGDGGGGWVRGFHVRPPWPRASGSRRRGPPRSARIRGAGPATGASAAPPLRLRLPSEELSASVPRRPRPPPGSPRRSERRPSASYGRCERPAPRPRHRFQNGAGLAGARFPRRVPARGREWAAPSRRPCGRRLPPPGSVGRGGAVLLQL